MNSNAQWAPNLEPEQPPKRKRRVFLWVFVAVQVVFLVWIIGAAVSGSGDPGDCGSLSAQDCRDAQHAGTAIGVGLVIALWAAVDVILGFTYGVYRLARRR